MSSQSTPTFRAVPDYPGYRVSDAGEVQSRYVRIGGRGNSWALGDIWRPLVGALDKAGRPTVVLARDSVNRTKRVCRLVLLAFVGPCPPGLECCHRDGNPANNRVGNLYWGTHADNMADRIRHGNYPRGRRHFNAKLTEDAVREMRRLNREGQSIRSLARRFGVSTTTAAHAISGKWWQHVGD